VLWFAILLARLRPRVLLPRPCSSGARTAPQNVLPRGPLGGRPRLVEHGRLDVYNTLVVPGRRSARASCCPDPACFEGGWTASGDRGRYEVPVFGRDAGQLARG